jgi:hypothetical protein
MAELPKEKPLVSSAFLLDHLAKPDVVDEETPMKGGIYVFFMTCMRSKEI